MQKHLTSYNNVSSGSGLCNRVSKGIQQSFIDLAFEPYKMRNANVEQHTSRLELKIQIQNRYYVNSCCLKDNTTDQTWNNAMLFNLSVNQQQVRTRPIQEV